MLLLQASGNFIANLAIKREKRRKMKLQKSFGLDILQMRPLYPVDRAAVRRTDKIKNMPFSFYFDFDRDIS